MECIANKGELPINLNEASKSDGYYTDTVRLWEKLQISKDQILKQHNCWNEKATKRYKDTTVEIKKQKKAWLSEARSD